MNFSGMLGTGRFREGQQQSPAASSVGLHHLAISTFASFFRSLFFKYFLQLYTYLWVHK